MLKTFHISIQVWIIDVTITQYVNFVRCNAFWAKHFHSASFQTTEKDVPLKDLKITIQKFNEKLENIDQTQKKSVTSFLKASELVKWMKNTLPGIRSFYSILFFLEKKKLMYVV